MMHHDKAAVDYKNKFPRYINHLFAAFANDRVCIKLNLDIMKNDYHGFETCLCVDGDRKKNLIKIDYIARIFKIVRHYLYLV